MDPGEAPVEDMAIDHRRAHVLVAKKLLDGADVVALFPAGGMANEWRKVWGLARLAIPTRGASPFTVRRRRVSCR